MSINSLVPAHAVGVAVHLADSVGDVRCAVRPVGEKRGRHARIGFVSPLVTRSPALR